MKKFFRYTHNADGSYRFSNGEKFKHWNTFAAEELWVVHLLFKDKGMSFEEVVDAAIKYKAQVEWHFVTAESIRANIALALVYLLEDGLVRLD
jgi:hypothetical protein